MRPVVELLDARVGFEGVVCASGDDVDRFGERAEEVCAVRCGVASASVSVGVGEKQKRAKEGRTVFIGARKGDHVFGEDLGDAADAGRDDVEACTGGFEDGDAKGLGEGRVEEDGAADEDLVRCWRWHREMGMEERRTLRTSRCRTGPSSSMRSWRR